MQEKLKILYLTSPYPYPSDNGGSQGIANDIKQIVSSEYGDRIKYFFANLEENIKQPIPFKNMNYKIFQAAKDAPVFIKFLYSLYSLYSYSSKRIATKEFREAILKENPDIIILDGFLPFESLPKIKKYKLIYVTHNIEYKFNLDMANTEKNILKKIWLLIKTLKIFYFEDKLINVADKVVCVSTSDYNYFKNRYPNKIYSNPHQIKVFEKQWNYNDKKTLFFCGAMDFQPNFEAIKWLANVLRPTLDPSIKIIIAGKGTDNVPNSWRYPNIEYLGFVSNDELSNLYCNSSAFICPIIYGSGIKMKLVEALGYGTPIISTKKALEGLNYIDIPPIIDLNLKNNKDKIEELIFDREKLVNYQASIASKIKDSINANNQWNKIINDCYKEL